MVVPDPEMNEDGSDNGVKEPFVVLSIGENAELFEPLGEFLGYRGLVQHLVVIADNHRPVLRLVVEVVRRLLHLPVFRM